MGQSHVERVQCRVAVLVGRRKHLLQREDHRIFGELIGVRPNSLGRPLRLHRHRHGQALPQIGAQPNDQLEGRGTIFRRCLLVQPPRSRSGLALPAGRPVIPPLSSRPRCVRCRRRRTLHEDHRHHDNESSARGDREPSGAKLWHVASLGTDSSDNRPHVGFPGVGLDSAGSVTRKIEVIGNARAAVVPPPSVGTPHEQRPLRKRSILALLLERGAEGDRGFWTICWRRVEDGQGHKASVRGKSLDLGGPPDGIRLELRAARLGGGHDVVGAAQRIGRKPRAHQRRGVGAGRPPSHGPQQRCAFLRD